MGRLFLLPVLFCVIARNALSFSILSRAIPVQVRERSSISRSSHRSSPLLSIRVDDLIERSKTESLNTLLSRDAAVAIISELRADESFFKTNEKLLDDLLISVEKRLRNEKRTIRELLGTSTAEKAVDFVSGLDLYDQGLVRAFLQSGIVEQMIGEILYEAIFEFLKRADIVGNVVNGLPLIGPIRQQITKELKKTLDLVLGPQVKTFLASFNRVAVQRMIDFVLRPANKGNFQKANRNLVEALLSRRVSELLPSEADLGDTRKSLFAALGRVSSEDLARIVDFVFEQLGDKTVSEVIDLKQLLEASPSSRRTAQQLVDKYLH